MTRIQSLADLQRFREDILAAQKAQAQSGHIQIVVGVGSCGIAAGALDTLRAVQQHVQAKQLQNVTISETGCIGLCRHEPIVEVVIGEGPRITYGRVTPAVAQRIIDEHILGGQVVDERVIESTPFPTI